MDKDYAGFDATKENASDIIQNVVIAPQPTTMKVEIQSRMQWLLSKELFIFDLEKTTDGLVGGVQKILAEFVGWECFGPTHTLNELRDQLCGDAKFGFDVNNIYLFDVAEQSILEELLSFDFQRALRIVIIDIPVIDAKIN